MRMKKPRYGLWAAILVLIVALTALLGTAIGKYIETQSFTGTLQITAELGSITLQESQANRQTDGSYLLDTNKSVASNTYQLLPGLDIPKNPYIIVENKTEIEAYLFVEVVDNTNEAIKWSIAAGWTELTVAGKHGGKVYVYKDVLGKGYSEDPIYILAGNQIEVKQGLLTADTSDSDILTFYACMGEKAAGADATAVYQYYYPASP